MRKRGQIDEKPLSGIVLIVEDSLLLAMDAEDIVRNLGAAQVEFAGTVKAALEWLESTKFEFVILDVTLGIETTYCVVPVLEAKRTPYIVTTGEDDAVAMMDMFPGAMFVSKPYDEAGIADVIIETKALLAEWTGGEGDD